MMDVATALVESSLAEAFLVIIVALFAVFGVVVAIEARWPVRDFADELAHPRDHTREAG